MSVVRPEFGPTLPELLGPRIRALPLVARVALGAVGALVVVVILWASFLRGGNDSTVVVREPIAFNFIYRSPFVKLALRRGEQAHVGANGQSFSVRPLHLPGYKGDSAGFLPVYAAQLELRMEHEYEGFMWRQDGRTNVNRIQGYEILFQFRGANGRATYGRRILLLPTTTARDGIELLLIAPRSNSMPRFDAVGRNGALKTSLRSFRLGTERP